jgi:hypothetical protein
MDDVTSWLKAGGGIVIAILGGGFLIAVVITMIQIYERATKKRTGIKPRIW